MVCARRSIAAFGLVNHRYRRAVVGAGDAGEPGESDQFGGDRLAGRDVARLRARRNQDPQPTWPDHQLQRRVERQRLTVEPGEDRFVGLQQEAVGLPVAHPGARPAVDRGALRRRADPQHPSVETEAPSVVGWAGEHVRVVGHHRHRRPLSLRPLGCREPDRRAAVLTGAASRGSPRAIVCSLFSRYSSRCTASA